MAIDPQIKAQLQQTIAVATLVSKNRSGTPTYAAAANRSARVEPYQRKIQTANGEVLETEYRILTENEIPRTARLWLPGDSSADATLARMPKRVEQAVDEKGGTSHWETLT